MDAYTLLPAVLADRSNMHAGHQGDDEWRRCRLLLQVHRLSFSHGGDLQKLPDGLGEDGGPGCGRQRGAHQQSFIRDHEGAVGRRLLPRRDQAQGRHPRAGMEVPRQGDRPPLQSLLQPRCIIFQFSVAYEYCPYSAFLESLMTLVF